MGGWWHLAQGSDDRLTPCLKLQQEGCCLPTTQSPATARRPSNRIQAAGLHGHLPYLGCCSVFGCLCQYRERMVPVHRPASAHSQRKNEMSGTGPQPGCAPAAHHSLVSPPGVSTAISQTSLLLLGVSPASWSPLSGNVHVGLGWFPSSCAPDVCRRRGMGRCLHRCLLPPNRSPMQDRDASTADPELQHGGRSPAATLGTLLQNSLMLWPEVVGAPSAASTASIQPAPALPNTPSSPQTAPRNTAFPWNVFV